MTVFSALELARLGPDEVQIRSRAIATDVLQASLRNATAVLADWHGVIAGQRPDEVVCLRACARAILTELIARRADSSPPYGGRRV